MVARIRDPGARPQGKCLHNSVACENEQELCPLLVRGGDGESLSYPQRLSWVRGGGGGGGHMVEHVRTSLVSLLWQCTALTPIFGLTPQPCFGCRLSTERAGLPGNISALK